MLPLSANKFFEKSIQNSVTYLKWGFSLKQQTSLRFLCMVQYLWCLRGIWIGLYFVRSNLLVAQNGRFLAKSVYLEGGTMVPTRGKILDFKLSEIAKNKLFRTFCSLRLSLKSWIFRGFLQEPSWILTWQFWH